MGADRSGYSPRSAWHRAMLYFAACWLIGLLTGVQKTIVSEAPISADDRGSGAWWWWFAAALVVIVVAYGVIWPKGTEHHDRAITPLWFVAFGVLWGTSEGQLFMAIWVIADSLLGPTWLVGVVAFTAISAFTGVWHDRYWDRLVAPVHNIEAWNGRKVAFCHVPNLIVTLTFFALYENVLVFIALQTLALTLSVWFMRFPTPSSKAEAAY